MTAALALLMLAAIAAMYLSGRRALRRIEDEAATDAFLDELRSIRADIDHSADVAHVHRLAIRQLPESTS